MASPRRARTPHRIHPPRRAEEAALRAGGLTLDDVVKKSGMSNFTAVVERDPATGLLVGYVPGFSGAHSQAETLDELNANLREVIEMLLEDGVG
jgi:predicted RNase H-like HicB family nuclease